MSPQPNLRPLLVEQMGIAKKQDQAAHDELAKPISQPEISRAGGRVSTAYEYLRNAAENFESHLLLQRAIKRFFKRELFLTGQKPSHVASELRIELAQSSYMPSGSMSDAVVETIAADIAYGMHLYAELRHMNVPREKAAEWVLAQLSVATERRLHPQNTRLAMANFAYAYCGEAIQKSYFETWPDFDAYDACLFIAVHQALLKSDLDILRHDLIVFNPNQPMSANDFQQANQSVERLYRSDLAAHLRRTVNKGGAPLRILQRLVYDHKNMDGLLWDRDQFKEAYALQVRKEYVRVEDRLNRGLIKSIVFLFITKVLIGVGLEVPFDIALHGSVKWLPLITNLLFPPVYMALLRLGLHTPSAKNSQALASIMDAALFDDKIGPIIPPKRRRTSHLRQLAYVVMFALPVACAVALLYALEFNVLQMAIFLVFFSTASSLGFRLGALVRELEIVRRPNGFVTSLFDFFYWPFVVGGQWLSSKYSQLNVVARFLDIMIELPLKTVLRLVRQWARFLDERREQLY